MMIVATRERRQYPAGPRLQQSADSIRRRAERLFTAEIEFIPNAEFRAGESGDLA